MQYICGAATFVKNEARLYNSCPFQLDVVISYPNVRRPDAEQDDEMEDEDEAPPEQQPSFSFFGDIEERLKHHKLQYAKKSDVLSSSEMKGFRAVFDVFKAQSKVSSIQHKRFCYWIDRGVRFTNPKVPKVNDGSDEMFMYLPLSEVADIPHDAVPEWELNASKTSILPNIQEDDGDDNKEDLEEIERKNVHITAISNIPDTLNGQTLIISFHAKSADCIRCWMHINGQTTRVVNADDLSHLLPLFFDCEKTNEGGHPGDWAQHNAKFNNPDLDAMKVYKEIFDDKLADVQYDKFQASIAVKE